jgi:hypothetical protein
MTRHRTAVAVLLLAIGCERGDDSEPALTPAARTSPAAERAIEAIAAARCDHEQRCNAIGATAEYMTREHCMNVMRADGYDELAVCGLGIRQQPVQRCLTQISARACGSALDRLGHVPGCRSSDLCVD